MATAERPRRRRRPWPAAVAVGLTCAACRAPTQARLEITTDVPCAHVTATSITVSDSAQGAEGQSPQALDTDCAANIIGDLVVSPSGGKTDLLAVRIVLGVDVSPRSCTPANHYQGCIVQRRRVHYSPHRELVLPIALTLACKDVPCDENSTCSRVGTCVSSAVDQAKCESGDCSFDDAPVSDAAPDRDRDVFNGGAPDGGSMPEAGGSGSLCATQGDVCAIAAGGDATCAVFFGGVVKCWGANAQGELGRGNVQAGVLEADTPRIDLVDRKVVQLAMGRNYVCGRTDDGHVVCWGRNTAGQLGLGDSVSRGSAPGDMGAALPNVALGVHTSTDLAAGGAFDTSAGVDRSHTCTVLEDGSVQCWGSNYATELGVGDANPDTVEAPVAVDLGGTRGLQVSAGANHTCVRTTDGLKCWGNNAGGACGYEQTASIGHSVQMGDALPFVTFGTGLTAIAVTAGGADTCVLTNTSAVKCWGHNSDGSLGLGDTVARGYGQNTMADALPALDFGVNPGVANVFAGAGADGSTVTGHNCALFRDGTAKCWGLNSSGQLGTGDALSRGSTPGSVAALPPVSLGTGLVVHSLALGRAHTCALFTNGGIKCWGANDSYQLGLGADNATRGTSPSDLGDHLPYAHVR